MKVRQKLNIRLSNTKQPLLSFVLNFLDLNFLPLSFSSVWRTFYIATFHEWQNLKIPPRKQESDVFWDWKQTFPSRKILYSAGAFTIISVFIYNIWKVFKMGLYFQSKFNVTQQFDNKDMLNFRTPGTSNYCSQFEFQEEITATQKADRKRKLVWNVLEFLFFKRKSNCLHTPCGH